LEPSGSFLLGVNMQLETKKINDLNPAQYNPRKVFQLTQNVQKLTELPDRKLLCIMTMILEKGKDASVRCATAGTEAPETSPKNMVSITKYELIEKPDEGVF